MKCTATTRFALIAVVMSVISMVPTLQARPCSNATAAGSWGFTTSGTFLFPSPSGPVLVPNVNVSIFTADEAGNFVGSQTRNVAGVATDETIRGTLSVNSDCTGTIIARAFDASSGALVDTSTLNIVLVDDGRKLRALFVNTVDAHGAPVRSVQSVAGERVLANDEDEEDGCTLATLKGQFGVSINGTVIGFGPLVDVGISKFDGAGHFSIDSTTDVGGNVFPVHTTGTYIVNGNCTGTAANNDGDTAGFVIVGDGREKEIIGIEIAPSRILNNAGVVATLQITK